MATCRGCGAELTKRSQKVYCSSPCQGVFTRRRKLELWLATGVATTASYPTHYIREFLSGEQHDRCAMCGASAEWQGLPLAFVLDHVDGNSANNRRENLRLVCPNCDSQLPTFKARNRGQGRAWRKQRYAAGKSY